MSPLRLNPHLLTPILVAALIAFAVYWRFRRSFGRQRVRSSPNPIQL